MAKVPDGSSEGNVFVLCAQERYDRGLEIKPRSQWAPWTVKEICQFVCFSSKDIVPLRGGEYALPRSRTPR